MRLIPTLAAALALPTLAAAQDATASLVGADGAPMGEVMMTDTPNGLLFEVRLTGVPEGGHGFHVHQVGTCEPDFEAAGDHYAPDGNEHGLMNEAGAHAGDLPNVFATAEGVVEADIVSERLSVSGDTGAPLMDEDGSAIMVHANPDSYMAEAGAGDRIACGVVEAM
ncbi:superoxide dismutase family protein [Wenxinia marina]|uniref:Cu/Zn superoxide dismutase n=1 Tax=Wenxinia marina DSM 24838 TaxID=1123501 RepID=A0A0D0QA80_9RHOB|nr:superoxide dismutase family protein [Wenxinia marina]KIQ69202.1 Cu/Zn superoxide dismutase [Wenxinia marina DSM 24838]GGL71128.1 superoxide dismutase [Cu-Zn] [Wenxinia marina]